MKIEIKKVGSGDLVGTMNYDAVKFLPYDGELIKIHNASGGVEAWVVTHVLHHYRNFPPGSAEGVESQLVVSSIEVRVVPAH